MYAAGHGDPRAFYGLGKIYVYSKNPQEESLAAMHLRVAAEAGLAAAQCTLGLRYRLGSGGMSQDFAEARKWYQLAADQGNSAAMGNLAELYEKGLGA